MANPYAKVPQLPVGVDAQSPILLAKEASGKNWHIVDGFEYAKRPGWRPVLELPSYEQLYFLTTYPITSAQGVVAAGVYVPSTQARTADYLAYTGAQTLRVLARDQLVCVANGLPWSISKMPFLYGVSSVWYSIAPNTSGAMVLTLRGIYSGSQFTVSTTLTSKESLQTLAATLSPYFNNLPAGFTNSNTTGLQSLYSQLAWAIEQTNGMPHLTTGGTWFYINGYGLEQASISVPTADGRFRAFAAHVFGSQPTNVQTLQFQDELLFAGQKDPLFSYDGYRLSAAGCLELGTPVAQTNPTATDNGAGNLNGTYTYILRPKITKPSGQTTYGPDYTISGVAVTNKKVIVVPQINASPVASLQVTATSYGSAAGYANAAFAPRRFNPLTISSMPNTSTIVLSSTATNPTPQRLNVGEYVTAGGSSSQTVIRARVVGASNDTYTLNSTDFSVLTPPFKASLGETVEIYRNVASGTVWYLVGEASLGVDSFEDNLSDATLITKAAFLDPQYVIQRPPDHVVAVAVHQTRIVVAGNYSNSFYETAQDPDDFPGVAPPLINTIYWSQPANEEFTATDGVVLDIAEGEELNSLISVGDDLYVGGNGSLWVVQGDLGSATTFTVNRIPGATGTVGNTAITAINGQIYAVGNRGLYALNGGAVDYSIGEPINVLIRALDKKLLPYIRLSTDKETGRLFVALPGIVFERPTTGYTVDQFPETFVVAENATDSAVFVYDPTNGVWAHWTGQEMYVGGGLVNFDNKMWAFPRRSDKPVCFLDSAWGNDGYSTPVAMRLEGPWQHNGDLFTDKNWARLRVLATGGARQNFTLGTRVEHNWRDSEAVQSFDLAFRDGQGYGQLAYGGASPYGDQNETNKLVPLTNQKALSVRAVFENSDPAEQPRISGWNFEVAENRRNMKEP